MLRSVLFKTSTRFLVKRPAILSLTAQNSNLRKIFKKLEKKRMEQEVVNGIVERSTEQNKLTPATINFVIAGNGGLGVPKAIYILTSEDHYLIGCSENTCRLATALEIKPFRPKHIFITSNKWRNIGGLVGFGMNLEVSGCNSIAVYGPSKLEELFYSSRFFGISAGIKVIYNSLDNVFSDSCFTIDKIVINPQPNENKKMKSDRNISVFNYHFKIKDRKGRLDLNKCIELKVPIGPLLRELKSGNEIKLPDGKIVKHSDVCAPALPGDEVLIIDCPNKAYLNSLIENKKLNDLINREDSRLKYVFHLSDISVVFEKQYQDWVNNFSPKVQHFGLNEYCANLNYIPLHHQLYYFNKFDSDLFKLPFYDSEPKKLPFESRIKPAELTESFNLGTKKYSKKFVKVEVNNDEFENDLNDIKSELESAIENYRNNVKDIKSVVKYPEITFMGTASAAPGKYRNSSSIFINLNENESCILDCGEGTIYEIIRHYGPKGYLEKLCNLKFIYSTHLHADHHIGLISILLEREKAFKELKKEMKPLPVFAANVVHDFLRFHDINFEPIQHIYTCKLLPNRSSLILSAEEANEIGLEEMTITRVPHCMQSTGISITTKTSDNKNFKIVYSGDCLPTDNLVKIGQNCDLLIHEATFSEHFEDEALKKRHSTTNQAIEQRIKMNGKFLILTHFSQRYSKLPLKSEKFDEKTGIAFDHLTVNPDNLKKTAYFTDILQILYKDDIDLVKEIIERRMKKNELIKKYIFEETV